LFFRFEMDTANVGNLNAAKSPAEQPGAQHLVNERPDHSLTPELILKQEFDWRGIHSPRMTGLVIALLGLSLCLVCRQRLSVCIALCVVCDLLCIGNVAIPWFVFKLPMQGSFHWTARFFYLHVSLMEACIFLTIYMVIRVFNFIDMAKEHDSRCAVAITSSST